MGGGGGGEEEVVLVIPGLNVFGECKHLCLLEII